MADDGEIDIEGEFDFKLEVEDGFYDANELPSKSANLLPEFTNPPWMLEQGWTMDSYMDEKSKATIERMLMEEQQYLNGRSKTKLFPSDKSPSSSPSKPKPNTTKRSWSDEEKQLFLKGLDLYGRSWTRISELIPTRTSLQVKNYAQQYFKNLAKKADNSTKVDTSLLGSSMTATELDPNLTPTSDPLASVLASVTTGQPTVTSLSSSLNHSKTMSQPKQTRNKKKTPKSETNLSKANGLDGVLPAANTIVGISGLQDIHCGAYSGTVDTSEMSPSVNLSGVGFLSGSKELGFDSSVGTLIHIASGLDTLAAVVENDLTSGDIQTLVAVAEDCAESVENDAIPEDEENVKAVPEETPAENASEEEDVDIDIENDDDNDNTLLLARSSSPTSVYERLLKSANVTPSDTSVEEDSDNGGEHGEELPALGQDIPVRSTETPSRTHILDKSDMKDASEDHGSSQNSHDNQSVENVEMSKDKEELPKAEERIIVNGITTSLGEIIEFPLPTEEKILAADDISDEEKRIHSEFFDGRQSKTPERYLKIRNHIIECWTKCKPNFLNKTSVRTGLKNCGDVNCIGRIHCFLECTGVINFGCEQAAYNNPTKTVATGSKLKHPATRDGWMVTMPEKLDSMRPRKRRIRDSSGHWVDEKELEGKTIEHKNEEGKRVKSLKMMRVSYDPFKLIPCQQFSPEKVAPFCVRVSNTAVAVMDVHAHISKTEVIGMLGGIYDGDTDTLEIRVAVPCVSLSTGMQCEMDPVSQTQASEEISAAGMIVVGWYHSHPTFAPNPSVRDIETQQKFQEWFAKGGNHFVGIILSPYNKLNCGLVSEVKCLTIGEQMSTDYHCNLPYEFAYTVTGSSCCDESDLLQPILALADRYPLNTNRVMLSQHYRSSLGISCLTKMMTSVRYHLLEPSEVSEMKSSYDDALQVVEETFTKLCYSDTSSVLDSIVNNTSLLQDTVIDNKLFLQDNIDDRKSFLNDDMVDHRALLHDEVDNNSSIFTNDLVASRSILDITVSDNTSTLSNIIESTSILQHSIVDNTDALQDDVGGIHGNRSVLQDSSINNRCMLQDDIVGCDDALTSVSGIYIDVAETIIPVLPRVPLTDT